MRGSQTVINGENPANSAIGKAPGDAVMSFNITGHKTAAMNIDQAWPAGVIRAVRHIKTARNGRLALTHIEILCTRHTRTRRIKLICDPAKALLEEIYLIRFKFKLRQLLLEHR